MHASQDPVRAALQWRVNMLGDAGRRCHEVKQFAREIHRLDGAEPQPRDVRFGQQQADEARQPHRAARLPAPAAQVDAAQDHFAVALCEVANLLDYLSGGRAPAAAGARKG